MKLVNISTKHIFFKYFDVTMFDDNICIVDYNYYENNGNVIFFIRSVVNNLYTSF